MSGETASFDERLKIVSRLGEVWAARVKNIDDFVDDSGFPIYHRVYPNAVCHYFEALGRTIPLESLPSLQESAISFESYWRERGEFPRTQSGDPDWFTIYMMVQDHFRQIDKRRIAPLPGASARVYGLLSALCSLLYLCTLPATAMLLFWNWRIALCVFPVGIISAILAKFLNGLKLKVIYGKRIGRELNEADWESGRRLNF